MSNKKHTIHCDYCGVKRIVENKSIEGLIPIAIAQVPSIGIDSKTGKGKTLERPPMVKCPSCGRGISMKKVHFKESKHEEPKPDQDEFKQDKFDGRKTGPSGLPL